MPEAVLGRTGDLHPGRGRAAGLSIALYMHDFSGGGVERMNMALLRLFRREGAQIAFLMHSGEGDLRALVPDDAEVVVFGTRRTGFDLFPLARYVRERRPDILLGSLDHNNIMAALAKAIGHRQTRFIMVQHIPLSSEATGETNWTYRLMPLCYRLVAPLAAGIVAVSRGVADDLSATAGLPRNRITVIYNPVIGPEFDAMVAAPVEHPWLQDGAAPVFITAGRLVPLKDHATLLRAFALYRLRATGRLIVLGTGPLRGDLEALASALGIAADVSFPGFVQNPLPYIREAAAFILTSRYEGFGNAVVEALGCGTPVIATDCPYGPAEILDGGRFGRLVPVGDAEALAAAMEPGLRQIWPAPTLRARAQAFSVEASASGYLDLFLHVLSQGG